MKISFDAKRAFQNFTGLGNYSRTLLQTLSKFYPENEYHLFTPKLSNNERIKEFLKSDGYIFHSSPGVFQFFKSLWRSVGISIFLKKSDIQIYHGLSHELPFFLPKKIKTVLTIHDLIHLRYPNQYGWFDRKVFTFKSRYACRVADVIVAISEQTKRDIVSFYKIDANKVRVIYQSCHEQYQNFSNYLDIVNPNDIKKNFLTIYEKYNLPKHYILYVGTINERKNALTLIRAYEKIMNQTDADLVIIGNGSDYYIKVKNYLNENNLAHRVHLKPVVDFRDIPSIYWNAEIFAHPSVFEGFGIPIIEALYCGVPVVCSSGSCFAEAAGVNSKFVEPFDVDAWAKTLLELLNNPTEQKTMREAGFKFVQKFKNDVIAQQWNALYQSLLK